MDHLVLNLIDYFVFSILLGVSLVIGVYFGFFSKQDTTNEYLFGGKSMGYIPVAVSLLTTLLSGVIILGIPVEIYLYGSQYTVSFIGAIVIILSSIYIFLPVFFELQLPCTNHYLELRFSKSVRKLSSIISIIGLVAFTSIIIYAPALAFSQVTGFSVHTITTTLSIVCITYTTLGGIKAVIWTDTFQFIFTAIGLIVVFLYGLSNLGGISEIWTQAEKGGRLQFFNMNPSIFERNTFWTILSGYTFSLLSRFSVGQKFVQKFLSVRKEEDARKAIWITFIGWAIVTSLCFFIGLSMYVKYQNCDPLKAQYVNRPDQTLPYFVLDVTGHIPGLPGIFMAGLVSSSLAAMSACLNTLGGMIYDDFVKEWIPENSKKDANATSIIKIIVVIVGMISVSLVLLLTNLGTIFEMLYAINSLLDGPILGLFILGMLIPWAGKKGALVGGYTSLILMAWIIAGSQWHIMNKRIRYETLPISIDGCPANVTINSSNLPSIPQDEQPMFLFRISVFHFTLMGTLITVIVGLITSYITGELDASTVNPDYVTPICRRFLPDKNYSAVPLKKVDIEQEKLKIQICHQSQQSIKVSLA